jgi:hypothetical protein
MTFDLPNTIALLSRGPATFDALLRNLPDAWTTCNEGDNTWTPTAVVAHLLYGERTDWLVRARLILDYGESRSFAPFDRAGHIPLLAEMSPPALLDAFALERAANLDDLRALNLQPADFARRGIHPAFGPVTLSQLLATWAAHDMTHLHQVSRILAHQYRDAVGPWSQFMGVLNCAGHSGPA